MSSGFPPQLTPMSLELNFILKALAVLPPGLFPGNVCRSANRPWASSLALA